MKDGARKCKKENTTGQFPPSWKLITVRIYCYFDYFFVLKVLLGNTSNTVETSLLNGYILVRNIWLWDEQQLSNLLFLGKLSKNPPKKPFFHRSYAWVWVCWILHLFIDILLIRFANFVILTSIFGGSWSAFKTSGFHLHAPSSETHQTNHDQCERQIRRWWGGWEGSTCQMIFFFLNKCFPIWGQLSNQKPFFH